MIDFNNIISELLNADRHLFHSEDDLKFAISQVIINKYPGLGIRLERPIKLQMLTTNGMKKQVRAPIDIVLVDNKNNTVAIEIKYKTKKSQNTFKGEEFLLANQGANDVGRYSFRKDIYRIEQYLLRNESCKMGFVFILTNDLSYSGNNVFEKNNIDKHFTFHQGAQIPRIDKSWNYESMDKAKYYFDDVDKKWKNKKSQKSHWTCKKELSFSLDLANEYEVNWKEYSQIVSTKFEYCLFEIVRR